MKIAYIGLSNNLIDTSCFDEILKFFNKQLSKVGEQVSLISYFSNNYDLLNSTLSNKYDIVFCIGSDNPIYNHRIKENISKIYFDKLETNEACKKSMQTYCNRFNITINAEEEMECELPTKSIPLCDNNCYYSGFMYKANNTYLIYLPNDYNFVNDMYNKYISTLLNDIININDEILTLRCYGILEKDIREVLIDEFSNNNIQIQIIGTRLDNKVTIKYNQNNIAIAQEIIASICSKLSKFIYSTEDTDLYETAINLLNLQKKKLVIAESLTLGNISLNLSKIDHNVLENSYIFNSFDSITKQFKPDASIEKQHGRYSVQMIYELDNILLQSSTAQIAVFVHGGYDNDICYVAIGDIDGIHVYKNKIISDNKQMIDTLSETTIFYLIKKLRQNDLQFR